MVESEDPQINFGFSPGTPDVGQPYFYFYAWPPPAGLQDRMPDIVDWHTGWHAPGGAIPYERFASAADPELLVLEALIEIYRVASEMLKAGA